MKREILVEGTGLRLKISKFTEVDLPRRLFRLDHLDDGTWRLTISKRLGFDICNLEFIQIHAARDGNSPMAIWNGVEFASDVVAAPKCTVTHLRKVSLMPSGDGHLPLIEFDEIKPHQWRLLVCLPDVSFLDDITAFRIISNDWEFEKLLLELLFHVCIKHI